MGNLLIFKCLEGIVLPALSLQDRGSRTVVLPKFPSVGECRNGEILHEGRVARRKVGSPNSRRH